MTVEHEIRDVIVENIGPSVSYNDAGRAAAALAPLLNRVRAEGAAEALESAADRINRDFQHLPSWDAAWEAGERTRDWEIGCTRTLIDTVDWLRARAASVRADAIEQNSEGNET